ncbi:MAG: hypothetical protein U9Q29_04805 [Campylobacterota bacterium]|nr:hypothetical protein [Campylobacterota bacterium]
MNFDISTLMMIFFILALVVSIWKVYAFLPTKQLADDDTTQESQDELIRITLKVIKSSDGTLSIDELFVKIEEDEDFDNERYWRFNKNRLNQLLTSYYIKNQNTNSIEDIYNSLK